MKIDINSVVTLQYSLKNNVTGEQIEATTTEKPMQFLYGIERVLPKFEEEIFGLEVGGAFSFSIPCLEAYGESEEERIVQIPNEVFFDESGKINTEHIFEGAILPMSDNEGNQLQGTVKVVGETEITMDFNHPLAGKDLLFEGTIEHIRTASNDEISHGHTHGEHGHHH